MNVSLQKQLLYDRMPVQDRIFLWMHVEKRLMIGIILANTGSPAGPDPDVIEQYLREYLMDDRIRQMPKPLWRWLLHKHILPRRKYSSAKRYEFIWTPEGSPLINIQERLATKVQSLFDEERAASAAHDSIVVRSAMSYGSPSIVQVLSELRVAGCERIVLLPMYPQSAYSPTLAVIDAFWRAQDSIRWHPETAVIDNYHDDPAYIAAIADAVRSTGYDAAAGDRLLFSFHAIPLRDEKAGDTYRVQIAESVALIAAELGIAAGDITVGFQSVFGPHKEKWTSPLSADVLESWRDEGFRVVYACPGFSADCLETLYDIPNVMVPALEGQDAAPVVERADGDVQAACNTSGRFMWVPTLNDSDVHARLVKGVLDQALRSEGHLA